jgi:acetyl esterase/lipase
MNSIFHCLLASLAIGMGCCVVPAVRAETPDHILNVWPTEPPGDAMDVGPEQDITKDTDDLIAGRRIIKLGNVKTPQAHVYLPPENIRTGASVVICPGGGFSILAWDLEGTEVAQWLNTHGVAAIVLKYRVPTRSQNPRWLAPAQDAQRAVSLVRQHASEWKLDADQVAILGFSAGGMTAVKATLAPERLYEAVDEAEKHPFRADRMILIYAAGLPNSGDGFTDGEDTIDANTPPVFMAHAFDDFVPVKGAANLLLALKEAGVPSELHVYDAGGHGYGLRQRDDLPVTTWTEPCEAWLRRAGWIE